MEVRRLERKQVHLIVPLIEFFRSTATFPRPAASSGPNELPDPIPEVDGSADVLVVNGQ